MSFLLNELSLHGQFNSPRDFLPALHELLKCRESINQMGFKLFCPKRIATSLVFAETEFVQAVSRLAKPDITRSVMIWISKDGPFWDDFEVRQHNPDDYFEYENQIVTDFTLGEAAFRIAQGQSSCTVSFQPSEFQITPLLVFWQKQDEQQIVEIRNFWSHIDLSLYLHEIRPAINSWRELLNRAKTDFVNLTFLDTILDALEGEPFNATIANHAVELFRVLDTLKTCFDEKGVRTTAGEEIVNNFFHRENAIFSDESESNKQIFRRHLTFTTSDGEKIFCPFHGKIRHRTFRLHFSWPIRHNKPIYIAYLGPKITKQ